MSDNIVFPCPACGTKYSVGPHHAGKRTTCKKCGAAVTVPSPQVANPTIVGGTRTIRRADIDALVNAEDSAPPARPTEVDMTGGAGVLRKEETVIGQPAPPMVHSGRAAAVRPTGRAPTRGPGPAPAGRPMPPGMGAPAKKNNMPMMLGIGGGVVGLILVVVLIVAMSGPSNQGGGSTAQSNQGTNAPVDPDAELLKVMRNELKNADALEPVRMIDQYKKAREKNASNDFKALQDSWADMLSRKFDSMDSERQGEVAVMLDNDKYKSSRELLEVAVNKMVSENRRVTVERMVNGRKVKEVNPQFKLMAERLGWKPYKRPAEFDDFERWEVEGVSEYNDAYQKITRDSEVYHDVGLYPPNKLTDLVATEKIVLDSGNALLTQDSKDGFAIKAREAFIRFKADNAFNAKWNRKKGRRAWCPEAMRRESETVDQIWTYTYWKPFIVYVEKPFGAEAMDSGFLESLDSKSALLQHLHEWFRTNFIDEFKLQRTKPIGLGGKKPDGSYYASLGEQAEKEGWPIAIMVLKDQESFDTFLKDQNPDGFIPGARAFYSPPDSIVVTWDDRNSSDKDSQWFNESVMIHETFHMLSDHYAASPIDYSKIDFDKGDSPQRPRYTSVLVQEGITDSVAGFKRGGGEGRNATYTFMELNHLRLGSWQGSYKQLGNKTLYRIQDMIRARHYGQCVMIGFERLQEFGIAVTNRNAGQLQGYCLGQYYASACQASYFFHQYKRGGDYPYRKKWWDFLRKDYTGEITLTSYDDAGAERAFKAVFGLSSTSDWDKIEKEYVDFTLALRADDVGKGGSSGSLEESRAPGSFGNPHDNPPALPRREDE